jgi:Xaa-Pro aminopeptidase
MEYSPLNGNPYVSYVDGGTIDLVRSLGIEVISSGAFLGQFTSVIDPKQGESHIRAARALDEIVRETWKWIAGHLNENKSITEYQVQQKILDAFRLRDLLTDAPPIVAINANSADPHYEPKREQSSPIQKGDWLLIDLWAKEKGERSVFGDITRVAVAADQPTQKQLAVFQAVRAAQIKGIELVKRRFAEKKKVLGCEVDDAVRNVIAEAGYGPYFTHRTGHSIEVHLHGSGTHIDNLEMRDDRPLLPGTCFSIEPGVYLAKEFGVRLESDVYIHLDGRVEVTGGEQNQIFPLLQRV